MAYCNIEWPISIQKVGYLSAKSAGKPSLKLKAINTGELEKQIVGPENNYRLKPLLKNQLQKLPQIKE